MNVLQYAFSECFRTHAKVTALKSGDASWSYEALAHACEQLASRLQHRHRLRPGEVVPLVLPRSPLLVMAQLAVLRAGCVAAPMDPALPAERLRAQLAQLPGVRIGWCEGPDLSRMTALSGFDWEAPEIPAPGSSHLPPHTSAHEEASAGYVLFTSGTSGQPKAVHLPLTGFAAVAQDTRVNRARPGDRWAVLASPGFDASIFEIWSALLSGSTAVIQPLRTPGLDQLAAYLHSEAISHALLTTSVFNALIEDLVSAFAGLRSVVFGGEAASLEHTRALRTACPDLVMINAYGPTECSVMALAQVLDQQDLSGSGLSVGTPVGQALVAWDVRTDGLAELRIGGGGLAWGYLGAPEETARRFVERDGQRWYCTGDVFRFRSDGLPVFVERSDQQIKVQGVRIELQEIESLLKQLGDASQAVALAIGTQAHDRQVVALITPPRSDGRSTEQILEGLSERLPSAAVPRRLAVASRLPMTLNGKVDRTAIAHLLTRGAARPDFRAVLQQVIARHADDVAFEWGPQHWTYRQWAEAGHALARQLRERGVGPGDVVPLLMPRSPALLVAMLAVLQVGAAYAPIDRRSPPERVRQICQTTAARAMLVTADEAAAWPDALVIDSEEPPTVTDVASARHEQWADLHAEQPLYVMFTSGSTGTPKGVVVPGDNLAALVLGQTWADFSPQARWLFCNSPAFDMSCLEIWGALLHGATLVILPGDLPQLDQMSALIRQRRVTHLQLPTATLGTMLDAHPEAFEPVHQLITGGERASVPHMRTLLERSNPPVVINAYGPTETTVWSLSHRVGLDDVQSPHGIPIGRPLNGTRVRVASPESPYQDAEQGELWIAGTGVASGYLFDETRTRERFVEWNGLRWYRTGDLVRKRGDLMEYLGRADRQIKIRGQRLELDEIERTIEAHPGVREACVLVHHADDPERRALIAAYSGAASSRPDGDALALFCARHLTPAALPAAFFGLDRLPVNNNGKVDRKALEQLVLPGLEIRHAAIEHEPAATPEEAALMAAWQEVLGTPRELGRRSHFLLSGGSSLLALKLSSAVHRLCAKVIHPLDVLRHPVLADMARQLKDAPDVCPDKVASTAQGSTWPLSQAQLGLLAADALDPTRLAYLVHGALVVRPPVAADRWQSALNALQDMHPMLRLTLSEGPDGWAAHTGAAPIRLVSHPDAVAPPDDLSWPTEALQAVHQPLRGDEGLVRAQLWPTTCGGQLFVWTLHHVLTDEVGLAELLRALLAGLNQATKPVDATPPFWMHQAESAWQHPGDLAETARRLAKVPMPASELRLTVPDEGRETQHDLPPDLQARVMHHCRTQGLEPFALFLHAFGLALQRCLRIEMPLVSTPFSKRLRDDMATQVDYCIDLRFIEAGAWPRESPRDAVQRIREAIRHAQQQQIQPVQAVAAALNELQPGATSTLSQFHLTWRIDPSRDLPGSPNSARMHRVPQMTSRHGLALHVAQIDGQLTFSIEAVQDAHQRGWVTRVWDGFVQALADLQTLELVTSPDTAGAEGAASGRIGAHPHVAALWTQWLGQPKSGASVPLSAHWFREGGSSLGAMRMVAAVNKALQLDLTLHDFLRQPTFGSLLDLVHRTGQQRIHLENVHWVGPTDASRIKVLLPGYAGSALGVFKLAQAMVAHAPHCAVLCVDLDAVVRSGDTASVFDRCQTIIRAVVETHAPTHHVELVGYSLGGLLALHTLTTLPVHTRQSVHVWLLDTYAPGRLNETLLRRAERYLARRWYRRTQQASVAQLTREAVEQYLDATEADADAHAQWDALARACARPLHGLQDIETTLLRTLQTAREVGLIWRNRSNGWAPASFRTFNTHNLDTDHLGITQRDASEVARILSTASPCAVDGQAS